jgi:Ca-activated chloride channel family protein
LEKSKIEVSTLRRYTEEFYPFALAAAAFILLELLLRWSLLRKFP